VLIVSNPDAVKRTGDLTIGTGQGSGEYEFPWQSLKKNLD
jgi:hypothetical protein